MDGHLKARWVEALRSGKYKQGKSVLRDSNNNYCCLGVLADIDSVENTLCSDAFGGYLFNFSEIASSRSCLPTEYRVKIGLADPVYDTCIIYNDGLCCEYRRSFSEIADYIEANA